MRCTLATAVIFTMLLLASCETDPVIEVDSRLQPYFTAFVAEADARGVDLSAQGLVGIIEEVDGASGQCAHGSTTVLRIDASYWEQASELKREFVVFHELGHCLLDRRHLDTKNTDGTCTSMMHSTSTVCENAYSIQTREAYLDELFTPVISEL